MQVPIKIQSFWTQCGEAECSEENFAEYGLGTQQAATGLSVKLGNTVNDIPNVLGQTKNSRRS